MFVSFQSMSLAATAVKFADFTEAEALFKAAYILSADATLPELSLAGATILAFSGIAHMVCDENGRNAMRLFGDVAEDAAEQIEAALAHTDDNAGGYASLAAQLRALATGHGPDALIEAISLSEPDSATRIEGFGGQRAGNAIRVGAPRCDIMIEVIDNEPSETRRVVAVLRTLRTDEMPTRLVADTMAELETMLKSHLHSGIEQAA